MDYKNKRRILIATGIFPPDIGGPATYSALLEKELTTRGFTVNIASFSSVRKWPRLIRHSIFFLRVIKRACSADTVFAQDPVSVGFPAYCAARLCRRRFVLKVVGDYAWEQYALAHPHNFPTIEDFQHLSLGGITLLRRTIERFVARHADAVVVPSMFLKKIILSWGVSAERVHVIYNAANLPDRENHDPLLSIPEGEPLLMSAGREVPWKGFDQIIDSLTLLEKKFPRVKLLLIGDGPDRRRLQEKVREHKVEHLVVFLGNLERETLFRYLSSADIFILNTLYEGFPHQILEVMHLGVPIITTDVGGIRELVDERSVCFVKPKNTEALVKAVISVLGESSMRTERIANAKKRAASFTSRDMITSLLPLL